MTYTQRCDLREIYAAGVSETLEKLLERKGISLNDRDNPVIRIQDYGQYKNCQVKVFRSQISGLEGKAWIDISGGEKEVRAVVGELKIYFQQQPDYILEWLSPLR